MTETVLFLCTGNSARSILAECLLNTMAEGRFRAVSAGSQPAGTVNPIALELLESKGLDTGGLYSKSWDAFELDRGGPRIDLVITVCDSAAAETCPVWPGHPLSAHWGLPDPAAVTGSDADKRAAFEAVFDALEARIAAFLDLDWTQLDRATQRAELQRIGNR